MTNDKELVEVWQNEFWNLVEKSPDSIKNSEFNQIRLEGFLLAKRSQPSVVLPKDDGTIAQNAYQLDVIAQLTAAGIKYTIGE